MVKEKKKSLNQVGSALYPTYNLAEIFGKPKQIYRSEMNT